MDKQKRIEDIYNAALGEFSVFGYKRANISGIAEKLGMTKGNLYFFINSKQQLYNDSIAWGLKRWQGKVFLCINSVDDPVEKFRILGDASYRYLAEDSVLREILIKDQNLFPIDPLNGGLFGDIHNRSINMIAEILQDGISKQVFRDDIDVEHVSHLTYSIYVMFIVKTYILSNKHSFENYFNDAVELVLRGVLK